MKWYDAHIHIGEDVDGVSASLADVEDLFERNVIDKAVVFCFDEKKGLDHGNERIRKTVEAHDHLVGLFRVDPAIHDPDDLRGLDAFAGYKFHPRAQDFSMQHVYEHLDVAAEEDKPCLFHTGGWSKRAHPEEILEAAEIHRDTDIIMAHTTKGYYFQAPDEFRDTIQELDNVYIDVSLHITPLGIKTLVDDLGADRVLFASDFPYGHPRPLQMDVKLSGISDAAMERVTWKNTDGLFFSQ